MWTNSRNGNRQEGGVVLRAFGHPFAELAFFSGSVKMAVVLGFHERHMSSVNSPDKDRYKKLKHWT